MKLKKLTDKSVPIPLKDSGYVYIGKNGTGSLNLKNDEGKIIKYALVSEDNPYLTLDEIELVNILKRDPVPGAKVLVYGFQPDAAEYYSWEVPVTGKNTDISKIKGFRFSKDPEAIDNSKNYSWFSPLPPDEIVSGDFPNRFIWGNCPPSINSGVNYVDYDRYTSPQYAIAYYGEEEIDWTTVWTGTTKNYPSGSRKKIIFYNCNWSNHTGYPNIAVYNSDDILGSMMFIDCNFNNLTNMSSFFQDCPVKKMYFSDNILNAENVLYADYLWLGSAVENLCNLTVNMPRLGSISVDEMLFHGSVLKIMPKFTSFPGYPYVCADPVSIPEYDMGKYGEFRYHDLNFHSNLQFCGGFKNLSGGQVNLGTCKKLTRASLLNIFNKLEETDNGHIILTSESYVKLTEDELLIAIDKGWTIEYITW
jgi:hypothetical protein